MMVKSLEKHTNTRPGYDETKYNAPGVFPIFKEKQTITVTAPDNAKVEDFETNAQTLMYEEQLNADFVFTVLPSYIRAKITTSYVKDGKLGFAYTQEEWREGLRYIKELYDLGLIDPLAFSQDSTGYKAMLNYEDTIVTAFVGTQASNVCRAGCGTVCYRYA